MDYQVEVKYLKKKEIIPFDEVCSAVYIAGVNGIILCLEREKWGGHLIIQKLK